MLMHGLGEQKRRARWDPSVEARHAYEEEEEQGVKQEEK
jgi:hypothetical protein